MAIGRVPVGNAAGEPVTSWANPVGILVGLMAVAITAYISAVFLCADAVDAGHPELATAFRGRAIGSAIVAGALAISGFAVIHHNAPRLFDHLTHDWGLALVLASTGLGLFTFWLLARRSFHFARYTAAGAVAALIAAWAAAQYPYMLPGHLTIKQAAAGHTTLQAALIAAGLAVVILGPALGWLFKLVPSGQLYTDYEPLDQHFNPIHAGQSPGPADATWPQP